MPSFITGPLLKYGIAALLLVALIGTIYIQHVRLMAKDAQIEADRTELNSERMVNTTLANQVLAITQDQKESEKRAAEAERALADFQAKGVQAVTDVQKEIVRVATPSDDTCSPALAAALGGVCPKSGSQDDHVAAAH